MCMEANEGPHLRIRAEEFERLMRQRGNLNADEIGRSIGMTGSAVRRVTSGEVTPGGKFVSCTLAYLNLPRNPVKFEQVFEVVA